MRGMSKILDPLVARLRAFSLAELEAIADAAGVAPSLPRHLRSGSNSNPTLGSIEPLLDFFEAVDAGRVDLQAILNKTRQVAP